MENTKMIVPEWKEYWPNLASATKEQRLFYNFWEKEFEKGSLVDVNGNITYIYVYLYKAIPPRVENLLKTKDIGSFLEYFEQIKKYFKKYEKIIWDLDSLIIDAYIFVGNFDKAWELGKKSDRPLKVNDFLNFKAKCKDLSIDGQDLFRLVRSDSKITKFGEEHKDEIIQSCNVFLDSFLEIHGINFIEFFIKKFDFENLTENDFEAIKEFYHDEKKFRQWKSIYKKERRKYPWIYAHGLFGGYSGKSIHIKCESIPHIISCAIENEVKRILRESENILRNKNNLPKVGEGWINETVLYYKIVELFPNQKIIQHGKPHWLSPQHIDIYFPNINLGLEYQGAQHLRPVDFFGGEEAFKLQQQRDQKKVELCKKNRCRLIHVFEDYDIENIKSEIIKVVGNKSEINIQENLSIITEEGFANNATKKVTENDHAINIWKNGTNFYSKKDSVFKIPKTYKITRDYLLPKITEIEGERVKIKNDLYSTKKVLIFERDKFFKFISKKTTKRIKLSEEIISQLSQLNNLWVESTGRNENNVNLEEVKTHCKNISDNLKILSKEWEKCFIVETSHELNELKEITCDFYEIIFQGIDKFIDSMNNVILSAENISMPKGNISECLEIKFDFTEINKRYESEIYRLGFLKNQGNKSGCLVPIICVFLLLASLFFNIQV
jgi:hypothetical protein